MASSKMIVVALVIVSVNYVLAQEYIDNIIPSKYSHLNEFPKAFEVKGDEANFQFQRYFEQIQDMAKLDNLTVIYKIKLETMKPYKYKKAYQKKGKSKKYNIPLKKNSMKLSNFEVWLRKMAEQTGHGTNANKKYEFNVPATTESDVSKITQMKQVKLKYKPIISKVKNYAKIIRPVKNRVITLLNT